MRGCKQTECLWLYGSLICWHPVSFAVKGALFLIIPCSSRQGGSSWGQPGSCLQVRLGSFMKIYTDTGWLERMHAEPLWCCFERRKVPWNNGSVLEMVVLWGCKLRCQIEFVSVRSLTRTGERGCWSPTEINKSTFMSKKTQAFVK